MYIRITKAIPREGLVEGSVVKFMNEAEARAHIKAEVAVEVRRKVAVNEETGQPEFVEHEFEDVPAPEAKE